MFKYIVEKVKEVTQNWKQRHLSYGGKEVLLKAVALAIPIYSMNVFHLTKEICEEINCILSKFWWSSGENRDLEKFNQELLGKQVWSFTISRRFDVEF